MTPQEKTFFDKMTIMQENAFKTFQHVRYRSIWEDMIGRYSDNAHFVYELLQNADDAGATHAEFILYKDELIFKHNGTRKFSISDPDNEEEDTKNGTLGDINSITSIGNSNKRVVNEKEDNKQGNKIGKFGIGFKSIFRYTIEPEIFETKFAFRIKNIMIPIPLDYDYPDRKEDETIFKIPFGIPENNHLEISPCTPSKAFNEIKSKLLVLDYPTLFLPNLQEIKFTIGDIVGIYKKEILEHTKIEVDTFAEKLAMTGGKTEKQHLWLFSRKADCGNYSVGYFLDDKGQLKPVDKPAFCFFPTKRETKLKFIIHAPFLLTPSREGIRADKKHNVIMIKLLAKLVADSLIYLRNFELIDDSILKIIPIKESDFDCSDDLISFKPFFTTIKEKMETEEILPTRNGYVSSKNAYWADALHLLDIISDKQLSELVYNPNAKWIFTKINRNNADSDVKNYFSDIKYLTEDKLLDKMDENFIESQPIEWFYTFYKWLSERTTKRIEDARTRPFFLDANYEAMATRDSNNKPLIFLPLEDNIGDYTVIHPDLLTNPETAKFLISTIGIEKPSRKDRIDNKILPLYENHSVSDDTEYFKILFRYYNAECPIKEISTYLSELKEVIYFRALNEKFVIPHRYYDYKYSSYTYTLYMPETEFIEYFIDKTPECFLNKKFYLNLVGKDEESHLVEFFNKLNIASEIQYLYDKILPSYNNVMTNDENNFKIIFYYYKKFSNGISNLEKDNYVNKLKGFIRFRKLDGTFDTPDKLYLFNLELKEYFAIANREPFLNIEFYLGLVDVHDKNLLHEFFKELGVAEEVHYAIKNFTQSEIYEYNLPSEHSTGSETWSEQRIDCSISILDDIIKKQDAEKKSVILWKRIIAVNQSVDKLKNKLVDGIYEYHFRINKEISFPNVSVKKLRETEWLVDKNGYFKKPSDISAGDMANDYDVTSASAKEVIEFFNIRLDSRLTAEENHDLNLMKQLKDAGFTEAEIKKLISDKRKLQLPITQPITNITNINSSKSDISTRGNLIDSNLKNNASSDDISACSSLNDGNPNYAISTRATSKNNNPKNNTSRSDISTRSGSNNINPSDNTSSSKLMFPLPDDEMDSDELLPAAIDYQKKLDRIKAKSEVEQQEIKRLEELQQKISSTEKYSFRWFKTLLEMEILNNKDKVSNSKKFSISFEHVEFDEGTQRTLILKYPNRFIPQSIEELENIKLELHTTKTKKTVEIEVAAVRYNTLSVKLKETFKLDDINLNEIFEATIEVTDPFFLLEELQSQFNALGFDDDYDMQKNLCENIEFVFGPPGTGKTTNLADKIIRLINEPKNNKILVMAPTNKAADVLVNKIIERDVKDKYYKNWLLRFGKTNDTNIEKSGVFHDKTFDIKSMPKNVTVTTIARFPYDFFMTNKGKIYLRDDINWDYIIIDEASMIMLAQILLPLYKKTPEKFIIAGDPFQIEPVTTVDLWKNENIYTLVELNKRDSFANPTTVPRNYHIELLKTQYRSVPTIGKIFSQFAYKEILKHARANCEQRPLNIKEWLEIKTLNIIKFPVSKYESIYRSRKLVKSPYHIYSALLTFEFVRALSERIDKNFSIGIITPYRAQADLIEKLFATTKRNINVQIGTIHTFQGDECDILFAVFNAPPNISSSREMFLNHLNIINVAISRARDYLFLVIPDDNTEGINNLIEVNKLKSLFAKEGYGKFSAQDIEKLIFGHEKYIEDNSFVTGHQQVNVYTQPERKYEIRSEDNAVDVQLHEKAIHNIG